MKYNRDDNDDNIFYIHFRWVGKMEKKKNGIPVIIPYNGKEIHSLTARSISKEFREGLKNNTTTVKLFQKNVDVDGENTCFFDHNPNESSSSSSSSPPSIDLKNMKKFWEEKISANTVVRQNFNFLNHPKKF